MTTHNLDIYTYKFDEVLDLFHLTYDYGEADLKRAKRMVLQMHPDKSRLDSQYFLFYKRAYELVYNHYVERSKVRAAVPTEQQVYVAPDTDDAIRRQLAAAYGNNQTHTNHSNTTKTPGKKGAHGFNDDFNRIYEQQMSKPVDNSRNEWWSQKAPIIDGYDPNKKVGVEQASKTLDRVRQNSSALAVYRGVQDYTYMPSAGQLYDDGGAEGADEYASCDPFAKFKYDDLRKVHKDQTVFAVSERDFDNVQTYNSVDQYNRARSAHDMTPMDKQQAEQMFDQKEQLLQRRMQSKQHEATLRAMQNEEKQKSALSAFLLLQNR